jgi:hypothetical protein
MVLLTINLGLMEYPQANKEHVSIPSTTLGAADRRLNKEPKEAPGHKGTTEAVNTKNWYMSETDLWTEFGRRVPFGKMFSSRHLVKTSVVGSASSFGRGTVSRLEEKAFGNT